MNTLNLNTSLFIVPDTENSDKVKQSNVLFLLCN